MKLFILSDPGSIHTKRWISSLSEKGIEIFLFGVNRCDDDFYSSFKNVKLYWVDYTSKMRGTSYKKLKYLFVLHHLKQKIREFRPDILHAHYASSYGLMGALTGFHPFIISVWGSDVYDFPKISFLHRALLRFNLSKSDFLLSTSKIMALETQKYTRKNIEITPFGVDLNLFKKGTVSIPDNEFIIGTIKSLHTIYGIDVLIKSFHLVLQNNPQIKLSLKIIGDGPEEMNLKSLVKELGIENYVTFLGKITNSSLPVYYNQFSVFVSLSNLESFGVVAVEAMACECPVVVSDADGYTEVVQDSETGFIVPKKNVSETAGAIQKYIDDRSLRDTFGKNGRKRVEELFDWDRNVEKMIQIYDSVCSPNKNEKISS